MRFIKSSIRLHRVILDIVTSHSFIAITIAGNAVILGFAYLFFLIEKTQNEMINTYLDAVWWAFATATTVGYGDIIPVTTEGKIVGIFLMLIGTALFAMFTALFAQSIFEDELLRLSFKGRKKHKEES